MSLQGKRYLLSEQERVALQRLSFVRNGIDTVLFDGNKELDSKTLYEKAPKLKEVPLI